MSTSPVTSGEFYGEFPGEESSQTEITLTNIRRTLESFNSQSNYLLHHLDAIDKREEEIELQLMRMEWKQKYLSRKSSDIAAKEKELEERLRMADDRCKELDATYELVERCYGVVREREDEFDGELVRVRCKIERLRECKRDLKRRFEKKEMRLELKELLVDDRDHEVRSREKKLGFIERTMLERLEEVRLMEKKVEARVCDLERRENLVRVKEKELRNCYDSIVKTKKMSFCDHDYGVDDDCGDDDDDPSYADLRLNVTMDGRALQMFLNGRVHDHDILRDEVIAGLRLSADPPKLVLDAMQGFYPEDSGNGSVGFDVIVVRRSCVLLLEQLSKMKPRIRTRVRERAVEVAMEWKGKMEVSDDDRCLEVLGFLQLVATYGLTCKFDNGELLVLFESCACHDRAPELCRSLGFADDVHDIIQKLILKHQPIDAMKLIYAFELVDIFPPVPILKGHLTYSFTDAEKVYQNGGLTVEAQIKCISMKLAVLDSVIRCIKKYGLESKYAVRPLEKLTSELKRQQRKCKASAPTSKALLKIQEEELHFYLTPISSLVNKSTFSAPINPKVALDSTIAIHTCPKSTPELEESSLSSTKDAEPFATDRKPSSSDTYPKHTSQTGSSILNVKGPPLDSDVVYGSCSPGPLPLSMTDNKRPRLNPIIVTKDAGSPTSEPVNPYWSVCAYGPMCYLQGPAMGNIGGYMVPP